MAMARALAIAFVLFLSDTATAADVTSCTHPDLTFTGTFVIFSVPTPPPGRTTIRFGVRNAGGAPAHNVDIYVEDQAPAVQNNPARIVDATVTSIGAHSTAPVKATFPYYIEDSSIAPGRIFIGIDQKNTVHECHEA